MSKDNIAYPGNKKHVAAGKNKDEDNSSNRERDEARPKRLMEDNYRAFKTKKIKKTHNVWIKMILNDCEYERYHSHADASEHFNHVGLYREKSDQILANF